jgi:PPOX class probable F420-dependent enzyme
MPVGVGINQRSLITMSPAEVDVFLEESRVMTMCTLNVDGTIHAVAMWFGFLDGRIAIETKAKSQKAQNLRRNPMVTCLFEAGDTYDELRGVELVGHGEIIEDDERCFELGVSHFMRYQGPYDDTKRDLVLAMLHKRIVVALHVDRVVSWDHRKLGEH